MNIYVGSGLGLGPTKIAAFDAALHQAGVENYNLLRLSSVIPSESTIIVQGGRITEVPGEWGDRLYVVMAEMRVDTPNVEAWAGLGWVQDQVSGRGLFVEHEGESKHAVERSLRHSLQALIATRKMTFGPIQTQIIGGVCERQPICALVVAVYKAEGWN